MYTQEKKQKENGYCNQCGKPFSIEKESMQEQVWSVRIPWGYFSRWDGEIHEFNLCEECYEKMIANFTIPVTVLEETELL